MSMHDDGGVKVVVRGPVYVLRVSEEISVAFLAAVEERRRKEMATCRRGCKGAILVLFCWPSRRASIDLKFRSTIKRGDSLILI